MTMQYPSTIGLVASIDPTDVQKQEVQVTIPSMGAIPKMDVYFLVDTTGSMTPVINNVKAGASDILSRLVRAGASVGADINFGVGNYRDFDEDSGYCFKPQLSMTSDTNAVQQAINSWSAVGGGDAAEGQFYALDQTAQDPGEEVGWRADAKRFVIWIGDAPGHDPICTAVSGLPSAVTETTVTQQLQQCGIFVLAISATTGAGLNADPVPLSGDYAGRCGTIGGTAGQASRIAVATGGMAADRIDPDQVVTKIIDLGTAGVTSIGNVRLEPDTQIAPFVRVDPAAGQGPLTSGSPHTLTFSLTFPATKSAPSSATPTPPGPAAVTGNIAVKVDGVTTGNIVVTIDVPDMSGKTFKLQNTLSRLYLQLEDPDWRHDGANVAQNEYTGAAADNWEFIRTEDGWYQIRNVEDSPTLHRYVEVAESSWKNGAELLTRNDGTGSNKEWLLVPVGASDSDGIVFKIRNRNSTGVHPDDEKYHEMVADIKGQSREPGTRAIQWSYWGNWPTYQQDHNQHWYMQKV
jgi:hypothetical protein